MPRGAPKFIMLPPRTAAKLGAEGKHARSVVGTVGSECCACCRGYFRGVIGVRRSLR